MGWSPLLESAVDGDGRRSFWLGHELVDEFLEFASGRCRPNTLRAYAHDLNAFFSVVAKYPCDVTSHDVLAFVVAQQQPRPGAENLVRISDGGAGLSASTIKRRLAAVSSLFGYLVVRGDAGVDVNPVPRRLPTRRSRRRDQRRAVGAGRAPACHRSSRRARSTRYSRRCAPPGPGDDRRDAAGRAAPLRSPRLAPGGSSVSASGACSSPTARAAINESCRSRRPSSPPFAAYLDQERPPARRRDAGVRRAERTTSRAAAVTERARRDHGRRPETRRARGCDVSRVAPHLLHPAPRAGMPIEAMQAQAGHRSIAATGDLSPSRQ